MGGFAHTKNLLPSKTAMCEAKTGGAHSIEIGVKETVPIVFVPGVMGTKLVRTSGGEMVWNPDSKMAMLWYARPDVGPEEKKEQLVGLMNEQPDPALSGESESDSYLEVPNPDFVQSPDKEGEPGWSNVISRSYEPILNYLQHSLFEEGEASTLLQRGFDVPVYAFGYNWTDDLSNNGEVLSEKIGEIIKTHDDREDEECEKVLLVTHSMGGLVARSACVEHGASEKVLGVVHGVQPVTGAAASYWRMKAGFERRGGVTDYIAAWALGTNGAEVTALVGNMPGVLQLLPSKDYTDNEGRSDWLHIGYKNWTYPQNGDPYQEIYMVERAYWRLIHQSYLVPESEEEKDIERAWERCKSFLKRAREFHDSSVPDDAQHSRTYHFFGYGTDHPTADDIQYQVEQIAAPPEERDGIWASVKEAAGDAVESVKIATQDAADWVTRSNYGGFVCKFENKKGAMYRGEIQFPGGSGDGTVPASSSTALVGNEGTQHAKGFDGISHDPAYKQPEVQEFTRDTIQKMLLERLEKMIHQKKGQ